jgi:hypothetical protein
MGGQNDGLKITTDWMSDSGSPAFSCPIRKGQGLRQKVKTTLHVSTFFIFIVILNRPQGKMD